MTEVSCWR